MNESAMSAGLRLAGTYLPLLDRARIYCCGITPYDVTHLGHAATFVWVDVLTRVLGATGVDAQLCRNVTDVDDVLFAAAERSGSAFDAFASVQQFRFDQDMTSLSVRAPKFAPRARRNVGQVIRLASALLDVQAAYLRDGSVYFLGAAIAERAGLAREQAIALAAEYGARLSDPAKDDPLDVAVWRRSEPGEPGWPSPWGSGRPGWHAECAAMSLSVLGLAVDVQCGGADLRFPHHAYQAAMVEAVTGVRPYARAHFGVGVVRLDGEKMAKSTGNLVLVTDVLADHPAAALRLCLIDRPWAQDWDYSVAQLDAATQRLERLYRAAGRGSGPRGSAAADSLGSTGSPDSSGGSAQQAAAAAITAALCDDLDVPAALAIADEAGGAAARGLIATLGLSELRQRCNSDRARGLPDLPDLPGSRSAVQRRQRAIASETAYATGHCLRCDPARRCRDPRSSTCRGLEAQPNCPGGGGYVQRLLRCSQCAMIMVSAIRW